MDYTFCLTWFPKRILLSYFFSKIKKSRYSISKLHTFLVQRKRRGQKNMSKISTSLIIGEMMMSPIASEYFGGCFGLGGHIKIGNHFGFGGHPGFGCHV